MSAKYIFFCAACVSAAIELTDDTSTVKCAIDPTCRPVTAGEKQMLQPIFGDSIDYEYVRVFDRPSLFGIFNKKQIAQTQRNSIYLTKRMGPHRNDYGFANTPSPGGASLEDDHAGDFAHEITHVWQYQSGHIYRNEGTSSPQYNLQEHRRFTDFGLEQQAEIVKYYFEQRRALTNFIAYDRPQHLPEEVKHRKIGQYCFEMVPYETKLKQELPVTPHPACQQFNPSS